MVLSIVTERRAFHELRSGLPNVRLPQLLRYLRAPDNEVECGFYQS